MSCFFGGQVFKVLESIRIFSKYFHILIGIYFMLRKFLR
jgi:hypothetical protein